MSSATIYIYNNIHVARVGEFLKISSTSRNFGIVYIALVASIKVKSRLYLRGVAADACEQHRRIYHENVAALNKGASGLELHSSNSALCCRMLARPLITVPPRERAV